MFVGVVEVPCTLLSLSSFLQVWSLASGFCFVTLSEHTQPVTAVAFMPTGRGGGGVGSGGDGSGGVVVTASLDGTVRAFDLIRYRCFRTFTAPTPSQFACLAVNPSGEVICAASQDDYQVGVRGYKVDDLPQLCSSFLTSVAILPPLCLPCTCTSGP